MAVIPLDQSQGFMQREARLRMERVAKRIGAELSKMPVGAKRRPNQAPLEKWFPYYAGYSIDFADAVLRASGLPEGASVYDPWNGSGTTTLAASRLGLKSYGQDLNPAAILLAKARLADRRDAQGAEGFIRRLAELAATSTRSSQRSADPLAAWLAPRSISEFRFAQRAILTELAADGRGRSLDVVDEDFPPLAAFLMLSLVSAAKSIANVQFSSNPARVAPKASRPAAGRRRLAGIWPEIAAKMAAGLPAPTEAPARAVISLGDACEGGKRVAHADFALTSPPYLTRLDYVDSTSFELASLGTSRGSIAYERLRRQLMGAPLVRGRGIPEIPESWPVSVGELLRKVQAHPSKASESYYYKTYWQYFEDAGRSLRALYSALRPSAYAVLVVQSSYYKDIRVDLPSLYLEMSRCAGFSAMQAYGFPVKTVISSIHPGSRTYRDNPDYRESILLLQRS